MPLNYYLSRLANPRGAFVISQINPTPKAPRDMTIGDVIATNLYLVDGLGNYDAASGQSGASVMAAIGLPGVTPVWTNTSWTQITNGWAGQLSVQASGFLALFGASNPIDVELAFRVTDNAGLPLVFANPIIKLWKSALAATMIPGPFNNTGDGAFAIPNGVDVASVTGLALASIPRRVLVSVRKPAGGLNIFASVVAATITTDGFTFNLSGQTDSGSYILDYVFLF